MRFLLLVNTATLSAAQIFPSGEVAATPAVFVACAWDKKVS